ncbi:MAG: bifunctional riboflavin kinase/FAD synthetase [Pseudomonadota bacterium]|nr:bifunctional riboflavin kinase/FAD synthetase [Pseudomonadota bacterium]
MQLYENFSQIKTMHSGGCIAIGNFDGVHLGHREVIRVAREIAENNNLPLGVLTFEPHPREYFGPDTKPFRLTPLHLKQEYIEELGVEFFVVLKFDEKLSSLSAEEFVSNVLVDGFRARHIVSGKDFVFGNKRSGSVSLLKRMGKDGGFKTTSVAHITDNAGTIISSTRIRELLLAANPGEASKLLGRGFEVSGKVIAGDRRGRQIGFPTANQVLSETMLPALGAYAVRAGVNQGSNVTWHHAIANLGFRPTFEGKACLLETHIFDFNGDLYNSILRVVFVEYIRPEIKFPDIEELKMQIEVDSKSAKLILENRSPLYL